MTDALKCSNCGATLPDDFPKGYCPRCLLKYGLGGTGVSADSEPALTTSQSDPVLDTLSGTVGPLPGVVLRSESPGDTSDPFERASGSGGTLAPDRFGRYELFGEIGRGGMGAIFRGRDPELGRELAVKVLLDGHKARPELVRRFVKEAQIGGQLQHPGIVPVYEFGSFGDARPYFTMKLVRGRTLAALLAARKDPAGELPRFLSVFEAIAQTVAYAHSRGVIHRDLKPSNVMVGSFGEVQVMDWGLAKVLGRADRAVADEEQLDPESSNVIRTVPSGSDADASRTGSVLGTPAYMAPEQANGDVHLVDQRADVFGLGAILCEVLTGMPPYVGRTQAEVMRIAALGDTGDACTRLDACGADADLIALAKGCLAGNALDRPGNAGDIAREITAYLTGVQKRLHTAERERAVAEARAVEESKRRRVTLALAASVLALVVFGGGGGAWYARLRERQASQVALLTGEANLLLAQARAQADDPARWLAVREAVKRIDVALADTPDRAARKSLKALRAEVESGQSKSEADRRLLERLVDIRSASAEDRDGTATDAAFTAAFVSAGIDLDVLSPSEAGARIAGRPKAVAAALVAAIDHWNGIRKQTGSWVPRWTKRVAAARAADPEPDRDALRAALLVSDREERLARLRPLMGRAGVETWAPATLVLLSNALISAGQESAAATVLRRGSGTHPGDAWVHYELGRLFGRLRPPQPADAIAAYMAARAVQPETAHALAHALEDCGRGKEAEAIFRDLTVRRPGNSRHLTCFGAHLKARGRDEEANAVLTLAIAAGRAAIRRGPENDGVHDDLGIALNAQGKREEAIAEYRGAIKLNSHDGIAHYNLGNTLRDQGKFDEAITQYRLAIGYNPNDGEAHTNLGLVLSSQGKADEAIAEYRIAIGVKPHLSEAHHALGVALRTQGKLEAAIAEYHDAIRLKPDHAPVKVDLGNALNELGRRDDAITAYHAAIQLDPENAAAHYCLGRALAVQGKLGEALVECHEAIRLKRDDALAHYSLGLTLNLLKQRDEAISSYREAIRLNPDLPEAHCNLGLILLRVKGEYGEALELLRKGHRLGSRLANWGYPSAEWVDLAVRSAALDAKLPAILTGKLRPADAAESLGLAGICSTKGLHGAAARLCAEAFAADRSLADNLKTRHRYLAAVAAALAGCGRGKDDPPPDITAMAALRRQAREWLLADLTSRTLTLSANIAATRQGVQKALTYWKSDLDLAGVRSPEALAKFPAEEQEAWRSFWTDVDAWLSESGRGRP